MSEVIGRGVIEVSADASKMNAAIGEARKSIASLGTASKSAAASSAKSIDKYVQSLQTQSKTIGKSEREQQLYKLALRGASDEQLRAANSALRLTEAYKKGEAIGSRMHTGMIALSAAATVAAGGMIALVVSSINAADHLNDLSKSTGLGVEDLSGLALAASKSGSDLDGVAESIGKLSQNIGKNGAKFRELGITAKDPLEAFKQLADVFVSIKDPQLKAALASEALGKSWKTAAPLLAEGGKNIGDMVAKGKALSGVTQEMADNADHFNDNLAELKTITTGIGTKLASEMLLPLIDITTAIKEAYTESGKLAAVWVGMGALGSFLFTDEFASAKVKIKGLQGELEPLQASLDQLKKNPGGPGFLDGYFFGDKGELEAKINNIKAQISSLDGSSKPKKPGVPTMAEAAAQAKAEADAKKSAEKFLADSNKSQLTKDLSDIKGASDARVNILSNAEKIMQAMHSAGLVDEKEYFAAKLAFINLDSSAQEDALTKEIARLKQEKLAGADKIDNAKKIAEAQAKLAKVRSDARSSIEINGIQEVEANNKVAQSYVDAKEAAQQYLETIQKQQAREVDGIGRGTKYRERQAGVTKIEDKKIVQVQSLDRDKRNGKIDEKEYARYLKIANDTYDSEIAIYEGSREKISSAQGDWVNGASEAFANYQSNAADVAGNTAAMFTDAFDGMTTGVASSISKAIVYGQDLQASLENVALNIADAFITAFTKIAIQQLFINRIAQVAYAETLATQTQSTSFLAAQNAFATASLNPLSVAGPEYAIAASATAYEIAAAYGTAAVTLASARGGFDIPAGVNPLTQLHEKEMVLPAQQANVIRDMAKNGGSVGGGAQVIDNTVINIDSRSDRMQVIKDVQRMIEAGHARLTDTLQRQGKLA